MTATEQTLPLAKPNLASLFQRSGHALLRYGLVFILIMVGLQKWTKPEAEGIQPWIAHSPLLSWLYHITSVQGASIVIGVAELCIALLIALRRWSPRLSAIGGAGAVATFLITLSFLFTTPNQGPDAQGFLIKDIFLLGAALWSTGESIQSSSPEHKPFLK